MSDGPQLAFSEAELALLARLAGAAYFPCTRLVELDEAGWEAVARGLLARGVLSPGDPPQVAADVERVLDVVLFAERSLWMTLTHAPGEGEDGGQVLWRSPEGLVRHRPSWEGVHRLAACAPEAVDDLLATALDFRAVRGSAEGPSRTLPGEDFTHALQLNAGEGAPAAADRYPAAAGYVDALQDCRRMTHVTSRRRFEDVEPAGEVTLVESPRHGLWRQSDDHAGAAVVVQRITPEGARDLVSAVVGTFG